MDKPISGQQKEAEKRIGEVWSWLEQRRRIIILSHERPDGDAFASVLALFVGLRQGGWQPSVYFSPEDIPVRYRPLLADVCAEPEVYWGSSSFSAINDFEGVLCLDTSNKERMDQPPDFDSVYPLAGICNIDHHGDNSRYGEVNWIDPEFAATAQMVLRLLNAGKTEITPQIASLLVIGIVTDCGGFRFQNTDSMVLRDAAALIEAGAEYGRIIDTLFFNEPYNKLLLKTYLLENAKFKFDGRLLCSVLEPEILEKLGLTKGDTEDCIDTLRTVAGVEVTCLIQPTENGVRFSLRSRQLPYNVADMAHRLGGGGHPLAAGISIPNTSVEEGLQRFLKEVEEWFY